MSKSISAISLLRQAQQVYDSPHSQLAIAARNAWRRGFSSGGKWMELAFSELRQASPRPIPANLQALGVIKYSLCSIAAILVVSIAVWSKLFPLALLCIPAFYAVEVQMVFLFPVALDGSVHPFQDCRPWTTLAGGTIAAMKVVMVLAAVMIFGGFVGQGFIRSWCLGCLAVVLWYEQLRNVTSASSNASANASETSSAQTSKTLK